MAVPSDPPNPAGASAAAFANARITPEEAERLASMFRPSWEADEAPVVAPSARYDDPLVPKAGRTQADVRGAVHALNGTHAPAPATVLHDEPINSVIIAGDPRAQATSAAGPGGPESPRGAAPGSPSPQAQMLQQRTLVMAAQRTLVMPTAPTVVREGRRKMPSIDLSEVDFGKRAKWALWLGLGAAALLLVGVSLWFATASSPERAIPVPSAESTATAQTRTAPPPAEIVAVPPVPPGPSAEQGKAATGQAPSNPPAQTAAPTASPAPPAAPVPVVVQPTPVVAAAPPPPTTPPARIAVPPPPRSPAWIPPPAPAKPVQKPAKTGPTIVRDVPF
ncbi:MAG: hypothetical protein WBY94_29290 [Polyangiaceae bacterium]